MVTSRSSQLQFILNLDHKAGNESNAVTEEGTVRSDNVTKEAVTLL